MLSAQLRASFGVIISASHNPFKDNGVKFVHGDGHKLNDKTEIAIERLVLGNEDTPRPEGRGIGRITTLADGVDSNVAHAIASMEGVRLDGMRVALDNAHGASSYTSALALEQLGADVQVFHSEPDGFNINEECGLLVEGFDLPNAVMMPHNPPHYAQWLEAAGLQKAKDLLALRATKHTLDLSRIDRIVQRVQQKSRAVVRRMNLKRFGDEMRIVWDLYNRIWERNWGFVPMSEAEFFAHSKDLAKVARPELMHIAEIDGKPVGFAAALPDVNRGIQACNGKLLPFGWWKFLSAMKQTRTIRVLTLGVVPEHRRDGLQMLVMHAVISQGIAAGFDACEASWILEDNRDMLGPLETLGHVPYRRYRIYTKPLR
jgi:GNAT superfamily N-acetyltransferase